VLRALRASGGNAGSVSEETIREYTKKLASSSGIDAAPEGGCALAVTRQLVASGSVSRDAEVVVYNTGSGASYR
jgi:threonine synthase